MQVRHSWVLCFLIVTLAGSGVGPRCLVTCSQAAEGARICEFYGYSDCVALSNATCEAILCPAAGGRVLRYALHGENVLYLPAGNEGWTWDGVGRSAPMHAGRFDIGPEQIVPPRPTLWQGRWTAEILGDRKAVLRSQADPQTGVRLEREFELDPVSSKLRCTQRIINISPDTVELCHWSRTFANGHGICVVPVSRPSRFPHGYVQYDSAGRNIALRPEDPLIQPQGDYLVIRDHPQHPKLGFDSSVGWLGYLSPQDLLFVKKFEVYPERVYNEVAGLTISVWYPDGEMVELEPIGPREKLPPQGIGEFTETWYLLAYPFPGPQAVDCQALDETVRGLR